jgi:ribosomal protein L29
MDYKKNELIGKNQDQLQALLNKTRKEWSDNRIEAAKPGASNLALLNKEAQALEEKMKEIKDEAELRGFDLN